MLLMILYSWQDSLLNEYTKMFEGKTRLEEEMEREIFQAEMKAAELFTTQVQLRDFNTVPLKNGGDVLFTDLSRHQQSESTAAVHAPWTTDRLEVAIESVEKRVSEDLALSISVVASIRESLGDEKVADHPLDLEHVKLRNTSPLLDECGETILDDQQQLLLDSQEDTFKLSNDKRVEQAVTAWFQQDSAQCFTDPIDVPRGSSMDSFREAIPSRMDVVSADLTRKVDYAATYSKGLIISRGKYATTASIWNSLRLLYTLKLSFFGNGPEEAITPTYPIEYSKTLGMCWSFVASPSDLAEYAVFSVSFGVRIYATQVLIEHPPSDVNDRANAAIRSFRVVGFESGKATGKAWNMGQFEYRLGDDFLQVFDLEKEVGNAEIPAIKSLSLLIDSNWGLGYSCLYRVRVHGHKVEN